MKKLSLLISFVFVASFFMAIFMTTRSVEAAFNRNSIISDSIFDNKSSMTASNIDAFLNKFPGSCISVKSGFAAVLPTGYNPTDGFTYGAYATAGNVIFSAAQAYDLNPQVLLATLQKEQGLVSGDATYGCGALSISASMGYGCPDSGGSYNYSGVSLFRRNGTVVSSVNGTCVNEKQKAGFTQQIIRAAWLLKFGQQRSKGNVGWAIVRGSWNNSDDPDTYYAGPMTRGDFKRCSSTCDTVFYDGYQTIDGVSTLMGTGATAALYWYTPHFHGNQLFVNIFESWFGSTNDTCVYPGDGQNGTYQIYNLKTNRMFLTKSPSEVCTATGKMGYNYDGIAFFPDGTGSSPIYRLQKNGSYLFTISGSEKDNAINKYGFVLEGVAFYGSTSNNASSPHAVHRLNFPKTGGYFYTLSLTEATKLQGQGFNYEGVAFYTKNDVGAKYPNPVYRLAHPKVGYLYTISSSEKSKALGVYGFRDEGTAFNTRVGPRGDTLPVYRLASKDGAGYFYTSSFSERKRAIDLGYRYEGIAFFSYATENMGALTGVYRLSHTNGSYLFTSSASERDSAIDNYGYRYNGVGFRVP